MGIDLSKYRKNNAESIKKIAEAMNAATSNGGYKDDRYWKLTINKEHVGSAVIRFLPNKNLDDVPFVKLYEHSFRGPTGKWYIERSLTTLGHDDPVSEANNHLWNVVGTKEAKDIVRKRSRKVQYICNVLVVDDPANPDNNGKVFLFKFGQKIFDKIQSAISPEFPGDPQIDVFNPITGANFKFRSKDASGQVSYEPSIFDSSHPIASSDAEIERILESLYDVNLEIAPEKFKSYDELKKKFLSVVGNTAEKVQEPPKSTVEAPKVRPAPTAPATSDFANTRDSDASDGDDEDSDDVDSFFAKFK